MTDAKRGVRDWPRERVEWRDSRGCGSAGLYSFAQEGWLLVSGPDSLMVEAEAPIYFDREGATRGGEPVPSTYGIQIPLEAFPALIERMQFALSRAAHASTEHPPKSAVPESCPHL